MRSIKIVAGAGSVSKKDGQDDRANIQRTWKVISSEDSGRKPPPEAIKDLKMIIANANITLMQGEKTLSEMTYKLDSTKKPKWIDLTEKKAGSKDAVPGIYELKGDDPKICFNEAGTKRPTKFVSEANSENDVLIILKRPPQMTWASLLVKCHITRIWPF